MEETLAAGRGELVCRRRDRRCSHARSPARLRTGTERPDRDSAQPQPHAARKGRLRGGSSASPVNRFGAGVMMGLPSLAVLDGAAGPRIWLGAEATHMRCCFDRLAARVEAVTGESPLSGHWFIFRSRGG